MKNIISHVDELNAKYSSFFQGEHYINGYECWIHDANQGMFSLYWKKIEYDPEDERFSRHVITQHDIKFGTYLQFMIPYVFKKR